VLAIEEALEIGRRPEPGDIRPSRTTVPHDREPATASGTVVSWWTWVALPTAAWPFAAARTAAGTLGI
jgi:hypothetical protein